MFAWGLALGECFLRVSVCGFPFGCFRFETWPLEAEPEGFLFLEMAESAFRSQANRSAGHGSR